MRGELDEKDFIQEEYGKDPTPFWIWSFIVLLITALVWGIMLWYNHTMSQGAEQNRFLQVTNREFSLFLWQNPHHMRVHAKNKGGYLPGFHYLEKVGMDVSALQDYVSAPSEILFLYHAWERLLGDVVFKRPIPTDQFAEFLNHAEEWQPKYWTAAPRGYAELVESDYAGDLQDRLPVEVKQAFIGWCNFFKEGEQINQKEWTYADLERVLALYPGYRRNLWCHLEPNYLKSYPGQMEELIPANEITPFLRVALYNTSF